MKTIVIKASARRDGDTSAIIHLLQLQLKCDVIDLNEYEILPYDYEYQNQDDDFLPLISRIVDNYEVIIFATPVYWYSMSGVLKIFIDRFTDLITIKKDLGKKMKNKKLAVITTSSGDHLGEDFWLPFQKFATYFDMVFIGGKHILVEEGNDNNIADFIKILSD